MTNEAFQTPKPGPRRKSGKAPARRADTGERRPLARAGDWTREHWAATRARIAATRFRAPSKRALYWSGGIAATLVIAVAILIAIWDWNWFRGPVSRYASMRMHREVTIAGDLDVKLWSWQPSATVDKVRIANPAWAGEAPMAEIERIAVQIRLLPLFAGNVDLRLLQFDRPDVRLLRDATGRATWSLPEPEGEYDESDLNPEAQGDQIKK